MQLPVPDFGADFPSRRSTDQDGIGGVIDQCINVAWNDRIVSKPPQDGVGIEQHPHTCTSIAEATLFVAQGFKKFRAYNKLAFEGAASTIAVALWI